MNKSSKSVFSMLLSLAMVLPSASAVALEAKDEYKLNLTFNDIATNQIDVDGLTIADGKATIVATSINNKGLYLKKNDSKTSVFANGVVAEYTDDIVYSIDIMPDSLPVNLTFGSTASQAASASSDINLFKVIDNSIFTHDGKKIGTLKQNVYTQITVVVKKMTVCDYYINGRKVISNWGMANVNLEPLVVIRQSAGSSCYIDNLRCYKGSKIDNNIEESAFKNEIVDIIKQQEFGGDFTFFDNRECYTSGAPVYKNFTATPKTNQIVTTRLNNYQSSDRTNHIYMKRSDNSNDCFFQIETNIPPFVKADDEFNYKYLKMEGDFKADTLQDINFLVRDSKTTGRSLDTNININADGSVYGGGTTVSDVVTQGKWFHLLWAMNLDTKKYDVYIDGKKILSDKNLNANMGQFNNVRVNLNYSSVVGDLYIDNFNVTGLAKPIVDGIETKTSVISADENVIDFLNDKIGMHAIGNTLYKDGAKTELGEKGIYDKLTEQYYVTADTLNKAFNLNLKDENGEITGDISVKADGTVTLKDGKSFKLEYTPKSENGKMYVPVRQFAKDAIGKHVWWFKTGTLLFADRELNIDTTGWVNQSERAVQTECTESNDIDTLDTYLRYIRPDAESLKADYVSKTGDNGFSQHPRLYFSADDFIKMKEKFAENTDPSLTAKINEYIKMADEYIKEKPADYTMWLDKTKHQLGEELINRFTSLGLAYHMTNEQKYADAAFMQFKAALAAPDFNTANISDAGKAAIGLAIGYDWFYNAFTPEQRELALKATSEKSLKTLAGGLYGRISASSVESNGWSAFKQATKDNAIVNAGVVLSALASLDSNTDTAFDYIEKAIRGAEYAMHVLASKDDGTVKIEDKDSAKRYLTMLSLNIKNNFGKSYNIDSGIKSENILDFIAADKVNAENLSK